MNFFQGTVGYVENFGTISLSTLESASAIDDESDVAELTEGDEERGDRRHLLYKRLQDLEDATKNFLKERPKVLTTEHGTFAELESSEVQKFEIAIDKFEKDDVLCVTVTSIPESLREDAVVGMAEGVVRVANNSFTRQSERQPLHVSIFGTSRDGAEFGASGGGSSGSIAVARYHNGEYTMALTCSHGIGPGRYLLTVANSAEDSTAESICVGYSIQRFTAAVAVSEGKAVKGRTTSAEEFSYYRFMVPEAMHRRLITVTVKPLCDEKGNAIGDPDLYVCNRFDGLVPVTRDSYTWKSANVGADRIDIHPDDVNRGAGDCILIGVLGYQERNEFELEVLLSTPAEVRHLNIGEEVEIEVQGGKYSYYSIDVDSEIRGRIFLSLSHHRGSSTVSQISSPSPSLSPLYPPLLDDQSVLEVISQQYGRGTYTTDFLSMYIPDLDSQRDDIAENVVNSVGLPYTGRRSSNGRSPSKRSVEGSRGHLRPASVLFPSPSPSPSPAPKGKGASSVNNGFGTSQSAAANSPPPPPLPAKTLSYSSSPSPSCSVPPIPPPPSPPSSTPTSCYFSESFHGSLPLSGWRDQGLYPLVYLSSTVMYPTAGDYGWRATGADGNLAVLIETDEWKYSDGRCYFSVYGYQLPSVGSDSSRDVVLDRDNPLKSVCRIVTWLRREEEQLDDAATKRYLIFQQLFKAVDGGGISQHERSRLPQEDQTLTYGEVEFVSFLQLLKAAGARDGHTFYDLGSGAGKAIVAAALSGIRFFRCVGIELLPGLCECARRVAEQAKIDFSSISSIQLPLIETREGDILLSSWEDADIVYIASICFPDAFVESIFEKAKKLKEGATLITLKLPSGGVGSYYARADANGSLRNGDTAQESFFELVGEEWIKMTWGRILVYILKRTRRRDISEFMEAAPVEEDINTDI